MKPLILTDDAIGDIEQAADWYDQQRDGLGNRFARSVATALDAIKISPKSYGVVGRQVRASLVRSFPFVIYYRELQSFVEVVAVIHAKRNPNEWKTRV
jgi:plasmid stabilization system protein ParE